MRVEVVGGNSKDGEETTPTTAKRNILGTTMKNCGNTRYHTVA